MSNAICARQVSWIPFGIHISHIAVILEATFLCGVMTLKATLLYDFFAHCAVHPSTCLLPGILPIPLSYHLLHHVHVVTFVVHNFDAALVQGEISIVWINPLTTPTSALPTSFLYFIHCFIYHLSWFQFCCCERPDHGSRPKNGHLCHLVMLFK